MGAIVKYHCVKCGSQTEELFIGPGMAVAMQKVVVCRSCNRIVSLPVDADNKVLPRYCRCECSTSDFVLWDGKCPKCGTEMSENEEIGLWD